MVVGTTERRTRDVQANDPGSVVVGLDRQQVAAAAIAAMQAEANGSARPPTMEDADDIAASAIFGPLDYHSTARNLRGGTLELWYGGGVLDLRDATLAPEGAG